MLVDRTSKIHKYLFKKLFFCVFGLSLLFGIFFTMIVKKISDDSDNAIVYIENWTVTDEAGTALRLVGLIMTREPIRRSLRLFPGYLIE